ncbi:Uncharacterised protein [Chlamydia trachomatis]|nr:Uncharacterised protein [Chlamydia trachomatis]
MQLYAASALEELRIFRNRARPSAFDVVDAQLVQNGQCCELVSDGQGNALLLGSVTQGRVVQGNVFAHCQLPRVQRVCALVWSGRVGLTVQIWVGGLIAIDEAATTDSTFSGGRARRRVRRPSMRSLLLRRRAAVRVRQRGHGSAESTGVRVLPGRRDGVRFPLRGHRVAKDPRSRR